MRGPGWNGSHPPCRAIASPRGMRSPSRNGKHAGEKKRTGSSACAMGRPSARENGSAPGGPPPSEGEVSGAVSRAARPQDVIVNAAGSLPGDLHKLWRTRWPGGYHMEYGNSCMGYEIAGGLGVKMADPSRDVYVMVGDASYLMMSSEIVTSIQEGYKLNIVILDNHGFSSIGGLSRAVGSGGFGTDYRYRGKSGQLDGG